MNTPLAKRIARFGWRVRQTEEGWVLEGNGSPAVFQTEDSLRVWLEKQEKGKQAKPAEETQLVFDFAAP